MTASEVWLCPEHKQTDCSPLLNGCSYFTDASQRLLNAVMAPKPSIEEDRDAAKDTWEKVFHESSAEQAPVVRQIALLEARVAFLSHAVADLGGLLAQHMHGADAHPREELAEYSVVDYDRLGYLWAARVAQGATADWSWFWDDPPTGEDDGS